MKENMKMKITLTRGDAPLDSSIPTPTIDTRAPNQVRIGTAAPRRPSSNGTTITCYFTLIFMKNLFKIDS